nr:hypothetical protein Itr_chr10CG15690 [Ipomoea trifida]
MVTGGVVAVVGNEVGMLLGHGDCDGRRLPLFPVRQSNGDGSGWWRWCVSMVDGGDGDLPSFRLRHCDNMDDLQAVSDGAT